MLESDSLGSGSDAGVVPDTFGNDSPKEVLVFYTVLRVVLVRHPTLLHIVLRFCGKWAQLTCTCRLSVLKQG